MPCHHIREYRYAYGAVEPLTGNGYFLVMPYCNTACMSIFLKQLSEKYRDNIVLFHIPPYTPEMNPIEQIWKEIRKRGFRNEVFASLDKVVDRLCDTICSLSNDVISSITGRNWIIRVYLKTVNMPKQRVFSACCAPFSLAIHKVFLRKNGFSRRKIPRCWSYSRFSDRP